MRPLATLITGASGEVGHALIQHLADTEKRTIVTLDLNPLPADLEGLVSYHARGSILDRTVLGQIVSEYELTHVIHLAAMLSTQAEISPETAHHVNVDGTLELLQMAAQESSLRGKAVHFVLPSSIAVFGLPDLATKAEHNHVEEWEWHYPCTMYGVNKLACENLGIYYATYYHQLAAQVPTRLDFRCVRFPGLISATTMPTGGTSDYGPEMLHAAAQNQPYACFVRPDVRIPFMAMPDAVHALLGLANAPSGALSSPVYNVSSFSLSAAEFRDMVVQHFPKAQITFEPDVKRQAIVDSWPADVADDLARQDWGWQPQYDLESAFRDYLVPGIRRMYAS